MKKEENRMYPGSGFLQGGSIIFLAIWAVMMILMLGGWVVVLIAIWRGMKAHESLAESVKRISEDIQAAK
jgi:hypothetical protein